MRSYSANVGLWLTSLVATLGAITVPAQATPFNSALVAAYDPFTSGAGNCGGGPLDCFNTTSPGTVAATNSYSQTGPGFSNEGYAQANLSTASLKIKAAASGDGTQHPYIQANATFGDGFTTMTTGGSPFVWNNTTATFNLNFGNNNIVQSSGENSAAAFVLLGINKKGTVNSTSNWFTGADTVEYFYYNIGNPDTQIYYTYDGISTPLTITESFLTAPASINATFTPGGDFDWVLLFGASGQVLGDPQIGGGSFNYDLSHTLTLEYVAPADTITTSDSGVFGTAAMGVPEPITLSIFGAGVVGAMGMRRRKKV